MCCPFYFSLQFYQDAKTWCSKACPVFGCHVGYFGLAGMDVSNHPRSILQEQIRLKLVEEAGRASPISADRLEFRALPSGPVVRRMFCASGSTASNTRWRMGREFLNSNGIEFQPISEYFPEMIEFCI